jgi:hypothetical protein
LGDPDDADQTEYNGVVLTEGPVYTKFTTIFAIKGGLLPEIDTDTWYTHSLKWEKTDALAFTDNNSSGLFFI